MTSQLVSVSHILRIITNEETFPELQLKEPQTPFESVDAFSGGQAGDRLVKCSMNQRNLGIERRRKHSELRFVRDSLSRTEREIYLEIHLLAMRAPQYERVHGSDADHGGGPRSMLGLVVLWSDRFRRQRKLVDVKYTWP